jgi:hypothetical protein
MDNTTGNPIWITVTGAGSGYDNGIYPFRNNVYAFNLPIGTPMPVYQALSTRAGGEVVSSDAY